MPLPKAIERTLSGFTFKEIVGDPGAPAVMLLHGYGADENDMLPLSQACIGTTMRPHFYFLRAPLEIPIAPGYYGRGWFPLDIEYLKMALQEERSNDIVNAFQDFSSIRKHCEIFIHELNIPFSKLFIGGFSQGAILATDIALNATENMAGLLIFSGMLIKNCLWEKLSTKHKGLHFFQSHGKHDPLLPFSQAEALAQLFLENDFKGTLHFFDGGHEIPHATFLKLNTFFRSI